MSRLSGLVLVVVFVLSLTACSAGAQTSVPMASDTLTAAEQSARAAAQDWLAHMDAGAWNEAWDATAPGFRDTVSQEQWREQRVLTRAALGSARSRRLVRVTPRESLAQAPDAGPFVHLRYHSTFGPELYVETVLVEDTGEAWQVAGYEVGPVAAPPRRPPSAH